MALNPIYTIANTAQISEDVIKLLLGVTNEALRLWGEVLAGNANVRVHLAVDGLADLTMDDFVL